MGKEIDAVDRRWQVKYFPEIAHAALGTIYNTALVLGTILGVVKLYELSVSWNCLLLLVCLLVMGNYKFVRD